MKINVLFFSRNAMNHESTYNVGGGPTSTVENGGQNVIEMQCIEKKPITQQMDDEKSAVADGVDVDAEANLNQEENHDEHEDEEGCPDVDEEADSKEEEAVETLKSEERQQAKTLCTSL